MKPRIGIMKIGANITWSKSIKTASNFDIQSICDILEEHFEIVIISKRTRNTVIPEGYIFQDILEMRDINKGNFKNLLIFNGSINFFGGAEAPDQIKIYHWINKFEGNISYVMTDGQLFFKQIWPAVHAKEWHTNWREEDLVVTREDIKYIYQGRDANKLNKLIDKHSSQAIKPSKIISFPIDQAILYNNDMEIENDGSRAHFDLIYGGAPRSGARAKKLEKFYLYKHYSTYLFGAIKSKNIKNSENYRITFGDKVDHKDFIRELGKAYATIIIGDDFYDSNFFTLRMYESILAGILVFIDEKFDPQHIFYSGDEELCDTMYVKDSNDFINKYESIMQNSSKYEHFINLQTECIRRNFDDKHFQLGLLGAING